MKKRILSVLLVFAMIFTLMPTALAAPTTLYQVVTVDKTTVQAGETVNVKVTLPNITEKAGTFTVNLKFDTTLFEVVSRVAPPKISATDEGYGSQDDVKIFANTAAIANTSGELTANASYTYNTMEVAGVTVIDATLKAKASGSAAFSFTTFEITKSEGGTVNLVQISDLETPPSVTIPKAPITTVTASVKKPEAGKALDFTGTFDSSAPYSITKVEWFEGTDDSGTPVTGPATAKAEQRYYARITLKANHGESFDEKFKTGAANGDYSVTRNSDTELYLTKAYPATGDLSASVTDAPKAKTDLKYTGSDQDLLGFAGNANGGTMQYSLDNSHWSTAIPMGKDAGEYTVYYKAKGNSGYSDSAVGSVSVTIARKDISSVTIASILGQPYTDGAIEPDPEVKDSATPLVKGTDYTVSCTHTHVGTDTATFTITGKGNYTGTKSVNFDIVAADQNPRFTTPVDLAKGGAMLDLRTLVQNAKGDNMTFAIASGTAATLSGHTLTSTATIGAVTIKVSITAKDVNGDGNNEYNAYSRSDAITVNVINKTMPSYGTEPEAKTGLKYDGSEQALVTEGATTDGTVKYSLNGTAWTDTVPEGKNAGDYTVYYMIEGDATHSNSTPKTRTVTIGPKEVTVSGIIAENKEYNGSDTATVNASGATFTGIVSGDKLTITATGTFANADVANDKTVNLSLGALSGASVGNYKLAASGHQTTAKANITAKDVKLTGGINDRPQLCEG